MAEVKRDIVKEIREMIDTLVAYKEVAGRSERGRLLTIVITHLETARLFLKESE